jgi:hypothetical protein
MKSIVWTMKLRIPVAAFVGLSIMYIIATSLVSLSLASPSSSSLTIDGIQCAKQEYSNIHIHMHLDIFINDKEFIVPSDIGFVPSNCLYWMHTHDDTGVIHIESPENRTFTLGQFFHIWGETFSNNQIFDNIVGNNDNSSNTLNVYVNGKKMVSGIDYRQIPLNEYDEIAIVYGKLPEYIPSTYEFHEGL